MLFIIFLHRYNEVEHKTVKIFLFDSTFIHENLLPLSFTRPVADFRCGILTIRQKWEFFIPAQYGYYPVEYLRSKYGSVDDPKEEVLFIAGNILPRKPLSDFIKNLKPGQAVVEEDHLLIFRGSLSQLEKKEWDVVDCDCEISRINYVYDIFLKNPEEIKLDFYHLTQGRQSQPVPPCVRTLQTSGDKTHDIFIEDGAVVECVSINTTEGPVYIGKDAVIMEGACLRGPFAACEGSEVRMGAKIYEGTTIGPHCKVGGEVANTIFFGFSNKAHDGYLGNAVIGEWCNIGAGVNASNLKNDYSLIRVWNYRSRSFMRTGLQFCGLIMGDHSKIGVNCMINTATVVGVGVNIHGAGFPRSFVPCFCEGSPTTGFTTVPLKKFLEIADRVMSRRDMKPTEQDLEMLKHIYDHQ